MDASDIDRRSEEATSSYKTPNFANIRGLTGEDEVFSVKRAESRIWEMCSGRWWDRGSTSEREGRVKANGQEWWRPLPIKSRHWQYSHESWKLPKGEQLPPNVKILSRDELERDKENDMKDVFAHGSSPFRTHPDAPPQFNWTHAWGMVKWGKKAGTWGLGPEGLEKRAKAGYDEQGIDEHKGEEKK